MKNDYITRAKRFIEQFAPELEQYGSLYIATSNFNLKYRRSVKLIGSGISRFVFITSDYCIKINKNGQSDFGDCESEYNAYLKVRSESYGQVFVPISKFSYKGKDYYIMPRCKKVGKYYLRDVLNQLCQKDQNFIKRNFWDLHSGNIAYLNGKKVFIDYAANAL